MFGGAAPTQRIASIARAIALLNLNPCRLLKAMKYQWPEPCGRNWPSLKVWR
jgi:hypothetical protein